MYCESITGYYAFEMHVIKITCVQDSGAVHLEAILSIPVRLPIGGGMRQVTVSFNTGAGNRNFVFLLTSNNINVRFRPQWSLDNVGVEMVSHRLQPNIVSGSLFAHISKQFVGVEFKVRNVNVGSEFPIRYGKAAPN